MFKSRRRGDMEVEQVELDEEANDNEDEEGKIYLNNFDTSRPMTSEVKDYINKRLKDEYINRRLKDEYIDRRLKDNDINKRLKNEYINKRLKDEYINRRLKDEYINRRLKDEYINRRLKDEYINRRLNRQVEAEQKDQEKVAISVSEDRERQERQKRELQRIEREQKEERQRKEDEKRQRKEEEERKERERIREERRRRKEEEEHGERRRKEEEDRRERQRKEDEERKERERIEEERERIVREQKERQRIERERIERQRIEREQKERQLKEEEERQRKEEEERQRKEEEERKERKRIKEEERERIEREQKERQRKEEERQHKEEEERKERQRIERERIERQRKEEEERKERKRIKEEKRRQKEEEKEERERIERERKEEEDRKEERKREEETREKKRAAEEKALEAKLKAELKAKEESERKARERVEKSIRAIRVLTKVHQFLTLGIRRIRKKREQEKEKQANAEIEAKRAQEAAAAEEARRKLEQSLKPLNFQQGLVPLKRKEDDDDAEARAERARYFKRLFTEKKTKPLKNEPTTDTESKKVNKVQKKLKEPKPPPTQAQIEASSRRKQELNEIKDKKAAKKAANIELNLQQQIKANEKRNARQQKQKDEKSTADTRRAQQLLLQQQDRDKANKDAENSIADVQVLENVMANNNPDQIEDFDAETQEAIMRTLTDSEDFSIQLEESGVQRFTANVKGKLVEIGKGMFQVATKEGAKLVVNIFLPGYGIAVPVAMDLFLKIQSEAKGLKAGDRKAYVAVGKAFVESVTTQLGNLGMSSVSLNLGETMLCKALLKTTNEGINVALDGFVPVQENSAELKTNEPSLEQINRNKKLLTASAALGGIAGAISFMSIAFPGSIQQMSDGVLKFAPSMETALKGAAKSIVTGGASTAISSQFQTLNDAAKQAADRAKEWLHGANEVDRQAAAEQYIVTRILRNIAVAAVDSAQTLSGVAVSELQSATAADVVDRLKDIVQNTPPDFKSTLEYEQKMRFIRLQAGKRLSKLLDEAMKEGKMLDLTDEVKKLIANAGLEVDMFTSDKIIELQKEAETLQAKRIELQNSRNIADMDLKRADMELSFADKTRYALEFINLIEQNPELKQDTKFTAEVAGFMEKIFEQVDSSPQAQQLASILGQQVHTSLGFKVGRYFAQPAVTGAVLGTVGQAAGKVADLLPDMRFAIPGESSIYTRTRSGFNMMSGATELGPAKWIDPLQVAKDFGTAARDAAKTVYDEATKIRMLSDLASKIGKTAEFVAPAVSDATVDLMADAAARVLPVQMRPFVEEPQETESFASRYINAAISGAGRGLSTVADGLSSGITAAMNYYSTIDNAIEQGLTDLANVSGNAMDLSTREKQAMAILGLLDARSTFRGDIPQSIQDKLDEFLPGRWQTVLKFTGGDNVLTNLGTDTQKRQAAIDLFGAFLGAKTAKPAAEADIDAKVAQMRAAQDRFDEESGKLADAEKLLNEVKEISKNAIGQVLGDAANILTGTSAKLSSALESTKKTLDSLSEKDGISAAIYAAQTGLTLNELNGDVETLKPLLKKMRHDHLMGKDYITQNVEITPEIRDELGLPPEVKGKLKFQINNMKNRAQSAALDIPEANIIQVDFDLQRYDIKSLISAVLIAKLNKMAESLNDMFANRNRIENALKNGGAISEKKLKKKIANIMTEARKLADRMSEHLAVIGFAAENLNDPDLATAYNEYNKKNKTISSMRDATVQVAKNIAKRAANKFAFRTAFNAVSPHLFKAGQKIFRGVANVARK